MPCCKVRTVVKLNIIARVVDLTYLHVIVKCESLLGGNGKARCTVNILRKHINNGQANVWGRLLSLLLIVSHSKILWL